MPGWGCHKDKSGKKSMYVGSVITLGQKGHQEGGKHSPKARVHRRLYKRDGINDNKYGHT